VRVMALARMQTIDTLRAVERLSNHRRSGPRRGAVLRLAKAHPSFPQERNRIGQSAVDAGDEVQVTSG
jgi:hypothetical protein